MYYAIGYNIIMQPVYQQIFQKLQEKEIRYLVIGGIAVNLHGVQRATADIDLMLAMEKENVLKFISLAKELGLKPRLPVKAEELANPEQLKKWKDEKNMKVFSFIDPDKPYICIDIMTKNDIPFEEAYKRKKIDEAWGIKISVASINDIIKLKQIAGREQDLADIEALNKFGDNR